MFGTLKTLFNGANARAEDRLRDTYSIELIDQKIREAEQNLKAAKLTLASMIQRQRSEQRQADSLQTRMRDLTDRAALALADGREDMARTAAQAIADLENETTLRQQTLTRLDTRIVQLRQTVEIANRRIIDLKQGAVTARAIRREQGLQKRLNRHLGGDSPIEEAEALINRVMQKDDPFEQAEILRDIDGELDHSSLAEQMEDAGYGPGTRSTAASVLRRLEQQSQAYADPGDQGKQN